MGSNQSTPTKAIPRPNVSGTSDNGSSPDTMEEKFAAFHALQPPTSVDTSNDDKRDTTISPSQTMKWIQRVIEDPKNRLMLCALSANSPAAILQRPSTVTRDQQIFNVKIPFEGFPVTNQRASGRCWIFAGSNVFRIAIMKKYHLDHFELSQAYLFFYDKLEKANYFLENIIETADEPIDGRLVSTIMGGPVSDGGQWDMLVNLVNRYGIVPQSLHQDTYNAQNSAFMDRILTTKLRQDAIQLRKLKNARSTTTATSIAVAKEVMLKEIVQILTLSLGPPPSAHDKFVWEFINRDKQVKRLELSPLDLAASLREPQAIRVLGGTDVHKLFSLVNDPRNEYNTLLTVKRLGNVWKGRPVTYVNVSKDELKAAAVKMLRRGWPVFFGSDVGQSSNSSKGIMDTDLYDYELGFNVRLQLTKAQRLETGESAMTHAMVLTGVHLSESGEPIRWRVENSWGKDAGTEGYFVMSDSWMDEFCYQAVVDPSVVSQQVRDVLKQKPKELELWDPMGALA